MGPVWSTLHHSEITFITLENVEELGEFETHSLLTDVHLRFPN